MIEALRTGKENSSLYLVPLERFQKVPGTPFAYWVSEHIRDLFKKLLSFEGNYGKVRMGLGTRDDFRFVRLSWEINPKKINFIKNGVITSHNVEKYHTNTSIKKWSFFPKGGEYSNFYSDVHLVVNWENNGEEICNLTNETGKKKSRPQNQQYYYYSGLTWSRRTTSRFSIRALPEGTIFSDIANIVLLDNPELNMAFLGIFSSNIYYYLMKILLGAEEAAARTYDIGILQRLPVPHIDQKRLQEISSVTRDLINIKLKMARFKEINREFIYPPSFQYRQSQIQLATKEFEDEISIDKEKFQKNISEIDSLLYQLYNISNDEQQKIEVIIDKRPSDFDDSLTDLNNVTISALSYFFGCTFGRWDIRYATGEKQPPPLPDPFAPLPPCSPGMLQGEDGLPLAEAPPGYPITIDPDGILVDDPEHPDDIIRKIREVLRVIYGDRAEAIEQEACQILGIRELRDYFRKPGAKGFWDDHIKTYSKSRRKAPIYWLLQSSRKNYAVWLYYPKLNADTLFFALERYVKPKVLLEERRLNELLTARQQISDNRDATRRADLAIEKQQSLVQELTEFRDKLEKAAKLYLVPDHDDGVVLNIAPLHELVPWREAAKYWQELLEGKYAWSSIGKQLKEKGIIK